jgi:hypothetical protein
MTTRAHFFPRLDIREAPKRERTSPGPWRGEWLAAVARAASVRAIPSKLPMPAPVPRTALRAADKRRKAEVFDE